MSRIVCDSSSLISMSENCILCVLKSMNKEFIIPPGVELEVVNNPIHSKRFQLKAIQLKSLIAGGAVKVVTDARLAEETARIGGLANRLLEINRRPVKIMHEGEIESIALYKLTDADALMIDERTARHLIESPEKVRDYMQSRLGRRVDINKKVLGEIQKELKSVSVIRSSELLAFAYENGTLAKCGMENALEAGLYALKFAGCSITEDEIKEYVSMLS
ncbi:hypothetical protein H0N95_01605 [Candidatus Micrarchaeota archaeon]|nr:hypothetical protein [Candidatus Micrarchaeota archaeon]